VYGDWFLCPASLAYRYDRAAQRNIAAEVSGERNCSVTFGHQPWEISYGKLPPRPLTGTAPPDPGFGVIIW